MSCGHLTSVHSCLSPSPVSGQAPTRRFSAATATSSPPPARLRPSQEGAMDEEEMPYLPLDIMHKILTHISDPASLACAASSCKLWRNVIKDASFLHGLKLQHLGHGFTTSLLLGLFYQDSAEAPDHSWQNHKDKSRCLAPSFIATSQLLRFFGRKEGCDAARPLSLGTFIQGIGSSLNFYEPIASQDSFLVLGRRSQDNNGNRKPDSLRVCNPLTGEIFHIPDLPYIPPDYYALLVTDDVSLDRCMTQSFQLVAIWIRGRKFIYLNYCSKTEAWLSPATNPELNPGLYLVSSSASASHGVIHWLCGCWKSWALSHVVTLHVAGEELSYLELPPDAKCNKAPLLASSADGGLVLLLMKGLRMSLWKHKSEPGNDTANWVHSEMIDMSIPLRLLKVHACAKVNLEIFRGKSGSVVLWIDGEGLFLFNLSDRSLRKLDNERLTKKYRFCPYEIDWLSCLAVTNLVIDESLSLDAGRQKVQGRWRTLVARNITKNTLP
ncbi:hypothetical protein ACP70R_025710 [Stipagrostis hirtigluma subsp. patula]